METTSYSERTLGDLRAELAVLIGTQPSPLIDVEVGEVDNEVLFPDCDESGYRGSVYVGVELA